MSSWDPKGISARRMAEIARRLASPEMLAQEIAPAFFLSFSSDRVARLGATPIVGLDEPAPRGAQATTAEIFLRFLPVKRRATSTNSFIGIGRLDGNDICIPDASVSKFHAFVQEREGALFLVDADSANGTFVERSPAPRRGGAPVRLHSGDTIRFGLAVTTFLSAADALTFLRDNFPD